MNGLTDWLPVLVGMGLAFTAVIIGGWVKLYRRRQLGESPPQAEKLLRPPGHHLQQELSRIEESLLMTIFYLLGSSALAGPMIMISVRAFALMLQKNVALGQVLAVPKGYMLLILPALAAGAFAWAALSLWRCLKLMDEYRAYRLGLRGELAAAEALRDPRLVMAGFTVFHDVPGDGPWNIDHVVVGPAGVFVLETKACHRRKKKRFDQRDCDCLFNGITLRFPWREDKKAVVQASGNARWVQKYIASFSHEIRVQPVVVVPGWYVKSQGSYPVKAMNVTYLVDEYLLKERRVYAPEQLHGILGRFDERCRTVEF